MSSTIFSAIGAGEQPKTPEYHTNAYFGHSPANNDDWVHSIELAPGIHEWFNCDVYEYHPEFVRKRRQVLIDTLINLQKESLAYEATPQGQAEKARYDERQAEKKAYMEKYYEDLEKEKATEQPEKEKEFEVVVDKNGVPSLGPAPAGMPSIPENF